MRGRISPGEDNTMNAVLALVVIVLGLVVATKVAVH